MGMKNSGDRIADSQNGGQFLFLVSHVPPNRHNPYLLFARI